MHKDAGKPDEVKFFSVLERKHPGMAPVIRIADNMAVKGVDVLNHACAIGEGVYEKISRLSSNKKPELVGCYWTLLIGFYICFFGGCFTLLIAAVEVVYLTSWDGIKKCMSTIYENYLVVREESRKDDEANAEMSGIADVKGISSKELVSRKLAILISSVDPVGLKRAVNALLLAFLAVVAALRDRFTQAMAFGCSLANAAQEYVSLKSIIEDILPLPQKKLASTLSSIIMSVIGMIVAALMQQHVMTAHCALRGAKMIVGSLIVIGKDGQLVGEEITTSSPQGEILIAVLTCLGFFWQASNNFSLPFPLNIILLPATVAERLLGFIVALSSYATVAQA